MRSSYLFSLIRDYRYYTRPVFFRNFFRNIRKIKNELRPSFASLSLSTFPPGGRLNYCLISVASPCLKKNSVNFIFFGKNAQPLSEASPRGEAPPRGGGEGRSPFLIEIFHRNFSIKGHSPFLIENFHRNFSNKGRVSCFLDKKFQTTKKFGIAVLAIPIFYLKNYAVVRNRF